MHGFSREIIQGGFMSASLGSWKNMDERKSEVAVM
jgi:hypothetical protein